MASQVDVLFEQVLAFLSRVHFEPAFESFMTDPQLLYFDHRYSDSHNRRASEQGTVRPVTMALPPAVAFQELVQVLTRPDDAPKDEPKAKPADGLSGKLAKAQCGNKDVTRRASVVTKVAYPAATEVSNENTSSNLIVLSAANLADLLPEKPALNVTVESNSERTLGKEKVLATHSSDSDLISLSGDSVSPRSVVGSIAGVDSHRAAYLSRRQTLRRASSAASMSSSSLLSRTSSRAKTELEEHMLLYQKELCISSKEVAMVCGKALRNPSSLVGWQVSLF